MRRLLVLLLILSIPATTLAAPSAREGLMKTPDGIRLFYKVVGRGPMKLVVVHGGPGNSLS